MTGARRSPATPTSPTGIPPGSRRVEPGKSARVELWFDPKTGTYTILNDKRENLPVERLWCGLSGRAYATRVQITLDRTDAAKGERTVTCSMAQDSLVCR